MSSTPHHPAERETLAAEYALGLLEGEELKQAIELERSNPAFHEAVERWNVHFSPMLDGAEPVTPPPAAFAGIERRIDAVAPPANDNFNILRRQLGRWRAFASGATALAASLALVLIMRPPAEIAPPATQPVPPLVAMIEGDGGASQLIAMWRKDERRLMVFPARVTPAGPGQSHELWVIPADGTPRSVGVMPERTMRVTVDDRMAAQMAEGVTLAVSLEPAGGSPTGAPTGPVLASGRLRQT
jgi:anti-sigma-K factor RskA